MMFSKSFEAVSFQRVFMEVFMEVDGVFIWVDRVLIGVSQGVHRRLRFSCGFRSNATL